MAPRRALAEHNGDTRLMTQHGSVAVGLVLQRHFALRGSAASVLGTLQRGLITFSQPIDSSISVRTALFTGSFRTSVTVGLEGNCSEVRVAPAQHLWPSQAEKGCRRALSRLPHNTFRMCSTLEQLLVRSDRGYGPYENSAYSYGMGRPRDDRDDPHAPD